MTSAKSFKPTEALHETLAKAGRGDADAWRVLVDLYSVRVYALLLKQCRDRELAEELTQDTFVRIVGKLGEYREQGKFESWLFRVAMNRLRDEMRRRKRHARPTDFSPSSDVKKSVDVGKVKGLIDEHQPLDALDKREQIKRMQQAVETLPQADRQILHLRHTAGLTFGQIAKTLDKPLGTVLARGHRALAKLRELLKDDLSD